LQRAFGGHGRLDARVLDPARGGGAMDAVDGADPIGAEIIDAVLAKDQPVARREADRGEVAEGDLGDVRKADARRGRPRPRQRRQDLEAGLARHPNIGECDVDHRRRQDSKSLWSIGRLRDDANVGREVEQALDALAHQRLVVRERDPDHAAPARVGKTGRSARSVSPAPGRASISTLPPIPSILSRSPESPRPARTSAAPRLLAAFGVAQERLLVVLFAAFGVAQGVAHLRAWRTLSSSREGRVLAHLGGMGTSCITTLTAFFVVNAPRLGMRRFDPSVWFAPVITP
jgi:hypothetical protein